MIKKIPIVPRWLGFAGLLPMAACLLAAYGYGDEWRYSGLAMGNAYAVVIFSFLGGLWWGVAAAANAQHRGVPAWIWGASVVPSLIAFGSFIPWVIGEIWPGPSLALIGAGILLSPIVDWQLTKLKLTPQWWMPLRLLLSGGLGVMTILLSFAA